MIADGVDEFLQWLNPGSHDLRTPLIEKLPGPSGRIVVPEMLEIFLEQVSSHTLQVIAQHIAQLDPLFGGQIRPAIE